MHLQSKRVVSSASYVATCTTHQKTLNSKHTRALYALTWSTAALCGTPSLSATPTRSKHYKIGQPDLSAMTRNGSPQFPGGPQTRPLNPARRKLIRLSTFHKIKHGIIDLKLEDHINPAQAPRGMATRSYQPDNYSIPHGTSTALTNSFFHRTAKDWNALPVNIKQIQNSNTYKDALQRHLRLD